ncbi:phage tail assembly protein T, partial [Escherichia coli]
MGRPDWRAMLAGMSSTEYADWHRFYSTHYFHDVLLDMCVFRSIRSRIGIEVRSAIRIHSINRELNFFYRFLTRFFAAFH